MSRPIATIRDVAAHAGVSYQTVSRVINGSSKVREETRARVEAAIAELDYRPNAVARSMASGRTGIIACIAPNLTDYTFASIIEGAHREARQHDFFLLSTSAPDRETFTELVDELITSRRTEGLIVIDPYVDELARDMPFEFPLVFAGGGAHHGEKTCSSVVMDDEQAAQQATEHLLQLGHHHIAMITGPSTEVCTQKRIVGYQNALHKAKIELRPQWIIAGDWSAVSGYQAFIQLRQTDTMPTAIFAQNDQMAVGVLRAARDAGLRLPEQLSVIGIDDIPLASYFAPPLTTMRQDFEAIGREASRLLIHTIESGDRDPQHLRLPTTLIERRSTHLLTAG